MYTVEFEEILFSIIMWLFAFLSYKSAFDTNLQGRGNYVFFFFIVVLYCTFAFIAGDFPHYNILYDNVYNGSPQYSLEDFYYNLILFLPNSYYLWRLIVWGLSTIILILTFKRLQCPPNLSCMIFILILMEYFSAPRNTLGYVLLYYALTFLLMPLKNRYVSYLIAFIGIAMSVFLHKSMPLYILIAVLSFIPMYKWMYILSFILFPLVYGGFYYISDYVLTLDLGNEEFKNVGSNYLTSENFSITNFYGYISLFVNRLPIILLLYYVISRVLKKEIQNKVVCYFGRYAFWLMYISFVFFNQPTSSFLSPRFWDASIYPLVYAFPLALYMKNDRLVKLGYKLLVFSCFYSMLYSLYSSMK